MRIRIETEDKVKNMEPELDQAALLKQIEIKRLESISNLGNLDKLRKSEIQTVPALIKNLLGVEAAGISVLDENTQHFLAESGLDKTEVPRVGSPCNLRCSQKDLVIENWEQDPGMGTGHSIWALFLCVPLINQKV